MSLPQWRIGSPSETAAIVVFNLYFLPLDMSSVSSCYIEGSHPLRRSLLGAVSNSEHSGLFTPVGSSSQVYTFYNWTIEGLALRVVPFPYGDLFRVVSSVGLSGLVTIVGTRIQVVSSATGKLTSRLHRWIHLEMCLDTGLGESLDCDPSREAYDGG